MDNIIVGQTDDPNYKSVGHLADGTPVYRYDPLPPEKTYVNEQVISEYNTTVKILDTETKQLLEKFKWEELKEHEQAELKKKIDQGYVKVFESTDLELQPKDKSRWNESREMLQTDSNQYIDGLESVEKKEKKKKQPVVEEIKRPVKPNKKKKNTQYRKQQSINTAQYIEDPGSDGPNYDKESPVEEPVQETVTDKSLWESYGEAKQIEKEIESKEDVSKSIADCYKEPPEQTNEGDSEVLGYFGTLEDTKLPTTENTTEYLTSQKAKEKEDELSTEDKKVRTERGRVREEEVADPFSDDSLSYSKTKEETKTTDYLELFTIEENQDGQKDDAQKQIRKAAIDREEGEAETQELKDRAVTEKVDDLKRKRKETVKKRDRILSNERVGLEKEYFRDLLEKKYASNEILDREYNKIKADFEEEQLQRREAAIQYLNHLDDLNEEGKVALKQYEEHIANLREGVESSYNVSLEQLENVKSSNNVDDEFEGYTLNVDMSNRVVTVTEKDTGIVSTYGYTGSLTTYKITDHIMELYSVSRDAPVVLSESHNSFTTHFFMTYSLQTGLLQEEFSYTLTKPVPIIREVDQEFEPATDHMDDSDWDFATFQFTSGGGSSFCTKLSSGWENDYPMHPLSAIAPDGFAQGYVRIGVRRNKQVHASPGNKSAITVRYLVTPVKPSYAAAVDYTIDWDPGSNPGWSGDSSQAFGSGYYNNAIFALDTEVSLISAREGDVDDGWHNTRYRYNGAGTAVNLVSSQWQTLTWGDNDFDDKFIYLRHGQIGGGSNYQNALKWYGVYLTFDKGTYYNTTADGVVSTYGHVRSTASGPVNASGRICPLYPDHPARGQISSPFFVAISGWSSTMPTDYDCNHTIYG